MAKQLITFVVDSERHRDIIAYLAGVPSGQKSELIRQALREKMDGGGVTLYDVIERLDRIMSRLTSLSTVQIATEQPTVTAEDDVNEPEYIRAALAKIGL